MKIITQASELQKICKAMAQEPFVTLDTEFHREKTYFPQLCLVQIGSAHEAACIDPMAEGMDLTALKDLLFNRNVLKVLHSASQDIEIFVQIFGDAPSPLFDTQIAAMFCGHGESIGYNNLVKKLCGTELDKSQQFTDWARRPLSEKQLLYALGDVTYLRDIYLKIRADLEARGRLAWVEEETSAQLNADQFRPDPENAWRRIRKLRSTKPRFLAVVQELARWREETAIAEDLPRGRVLKDDALLEIAHAKPNSKHDFKDLRGIHGGIAKRYGEGILEALERGLAVADDDCPRLPHPRALSESQGALVDMLKLLLKVRCREEGLVPRLIASNGELESFACGRTEAVPFLRGWREEVFGRDAQALREGRLSIGYADGKIIIRKDQAASDRSDR